MRLLKLFLVTVSLSACYDAGLYGYDHHYVPLEEEEAVFEQVQISVYNEVRTDPEAFSGGIISWFGVVDSIDEGQGGASLVQMNFRTHQERHLCYDETRASCRVTVSQASSGSFTATIRPRPEDVQGRNRIAPGSLLRIYCNVTGDYDPEGGPLLDCPQYRHWPRGQWAHTGMRGEMRR